VRSKVKVYEVLDDCDTLKTDLKHNKGKAVSAIIRGSKLKSNSVSDEDSEIKKETNTVMG